VQPKTLRTTGLEDVRDMFPSDPVTESVSVDCFKQALKIFLFQSIIAAVA